MKSIIFSSAIIITVILFSSCSTTLYTTNAVNAPLLKDKGEIKVNITQNDLQAAVAVTENIGIMANGFYKNYNGDNNYNHRGAMGELGIGYFTNSENNLVFETFVGAGYGQINKSEKFTDFANNPYTASFDARAAKGFLQTNLGFRSKYFDIALTPKFSFVKYIFFDQSNYSNDELKKDYLDENKLTNPIFIFAEPAITIRGGYKFIKIQAQYGLTLNVTGQNIKQSPDFASIGLIFDIAKWYRD